MKNLLTNHCAVWTRQPSRVELSVQQPSPGNWSIAVEAKSISADESPFEVTAITRESTTTTNNSAGGVIVVFALMLLAFGGGAVWIVASAQSGSASAPMLCMVQGNLARPVLRLTRAQSFIGRDRRNALVLADPSVSVQHARITRHTNGYAIYDLNSKNGVFVNGKRVNQHLLRDGDRIQIGVQEMIYKQAIPPPTKKV